MVTLTNTENKLRKAGERYESSGRLELVWVERKANRQARNTMKALRALCKQYNGHREWMVVAVLVTGTTVTNVEPCGEDRFTGLRYYPKAAGQVPSGERITFSTAKVKEACVRKKNATITRR